MTDCRTRYPLLLLHGLNCRDDCPCYYFGRIPAALEDHGAVVYLGGQDAWGTVNGNARFLKERIQSILAQEKCGKLNIIAHSKGGLEARCLISTLGMAEAVASLTTIATPHYGSRTVQHWLGRQQVLAAVSAGMAVFWRQLGDHDPQILQVLRELTPAAMARFNADTPDAADVYYQSWGLSLGSRRHDPVMALTRRLLLAYDGENDGLVSPQAARWGHWRGTLEGLSHQDITDCRQKNPVHFHTQTFYLLLARQLAAMGF